MKLVLASKNKKKLVEMNAILSQLGIEVCSEAEAGVDIDVEETGTTFEENSLLKAKAVMEASGLPAIADDSGLCVTCLNDAPVSTPPATAGRGWTMWDAISSCWPICVGSLTAAQNLSASSPAASPTATLSPPGASAPVPSPSPPWGRAASAMTPCSSSPG